MFGKTLEELDRDIRREHRELELFKDDFNSKNVGFTGIKFASGDFHPTYRKFEEECKARERHLYEIAKEIESKGGVVPFIEYSSGRRNTESSSPALSSTSSYSSPADTEAFDEWVGVLIKLVVVAFILWFVIQFFAFCITPILAWVLLFKFRLFQNLITTYERWVFLVGTTVWGASKILNFYHFGNGYFGPISIVALIVTVAMLAGEITYRVVQNRKYNY